MHFYDETPQALLARGDLAEARLFWNGGSTLRNGVSMIETSSYNREMVVSERPKLPAIPGNPSQTSGDGRQPLQVEPLQPQQWRATPALSALSGSVEEVRLGRPRTTTKQSKPNIIDEVNRTLPPGFELYRSYRFQLGGKFEIVMLKIHVPVDLEPKLKEWRQGLEEKFPLTSIFIRRVAVDQNLSKHLRSRFRDTELITAIARPQLSEMIDHLCGAPPPPALEPRTELPVRENFQNIPFIAIDRPNVLNREDLIYGERKHDGKLILKVAIIDITDYVRLGSKQDRYGLRVGNDYYGRSRTISTIGSALSQDKGSFKFGEVRPAWVAELRISPKSGLEFDSFKLRRAWVKNHANVDPDEPFNVKAQPDIAPILSALADITRVLEHHRISRSQMIPVDGEGAASRIVGETMIAANELISEWFERKLKIPAGYIVHKEPTELDHVEWLKALQQLRIPCSLEDFQDPWAKMGILRSLEEHNSPLARTLENSILDVSMVRSVVSSRNDKHLGLRLKGYTRIKPREALGILNQLALDAALTGGPLIPSEEIERRLRTINDMRWKRDERHYKLRFFEMLEEKLGLVGSLFLGEVSQVEQRVAFYKDGAPWHRAPGEAEAANPEISRAWESYLKSIALDNESSAKVPVLLPNGVEARLESGQLRVQVEGFSKWGIITQTSGLALRPGDPVAVTLKGFNVKEMRFEFEVTTL